jgi:hypothetical protein
MTAPVAVPVAPPLVNIYDVELVHAGQWDISTGTWVATAEDLAYAVAALDCPAVRSPVIKIGHTDPRFDGEPAVGWIGGMRVIDGYTLAGNYMGLPGWLAATDAVGNSVLSSAYPDRSVEGRYDYRCQLGHLHPFVIEAVALLGVTPPGIGTLASLQDIAALYGVVASAHEPSGVPVSTVVHAAKAAAMKETAVPNPRPLTVAAGVTTEDVRRRYYDDAAWSHWITEVQLDPLQLIVVDDNSGKYFRVPVSIDGEDDFSFGTPVEVVVRYIDVPADGNVSASRLVYASRAESRPGAVPAGPDAQGTDAANDPAIAAAVRAELDRRAAPRAGTEPPAAPPAEPQPDPTQPPPPDPVPGGTPHVPAAEPANPTQEEQMPLSTEVRQRLGLADDADSDAVNAAILAALEPKPAEPAPEPAPGEPQPDPTEPEPAPEPQAVAAALPPEAQAELARMSKELADIRAEKAATVKRNLFDAAVKAGKMRPADRADWEKRYDQAPDVITEIVNAMADGSAVPVQASGYTGEAEPGTDADAEYDAITSRIDGPYAKKGANV